MTRLLVLLGMLLATLSPGNASAAPAGSSSVLAVLDVTVIPMTGGPPLAHRSVLIRDGVIQAIGAVDEVALPVGVRTIDGRGRYLMPGLADMHAHLNWELGAPEGTAPSSELRLILLSYLATGVTVVRDMAGSPARLQVRREVAAGLYPGPRIVEASPIVEGERAVWGASVKLTEPEDAEALVAGFAVHGYEAVKVYHTLSAPVYEAVVAAARRHGLPVVGHVPFEVGIERALASGQRGIEHMRGYDFDRLPREILAKDGGRSAERLGSWLRMSDARMAELARMTAAGGVWNTPTLVTNQFLSDPDRRASLIGDPAFPLLPPSVQRAVRAANVDDIFSPPAKRAIREALPRQRAFLKALYEAGAPLMVGTDTSTAFLVRGFTPIDEIQEFVQAGLPASEALAAATIAPARFLGLQDEIGSVAVGRRADLILLNADPLSDVANLWNLEGVIVGGIWRAKADMLVEIRNLRGALGPQ